MVSKAELLAWVNTLSDESCIGIDDGGLCLREVLADDTMGEAYMEIGGIPPCTEHPCAAVLMPGECCELCGKVAEEDGP